MRKIAPSTPLVMVAVGDPVGTGLVQSLSRPGVNATGLSSIAPDMEGKRLQLFREMIPTLSRVAILWNPANPFHVSSSNQARQAARALGINLTFISARSTDELPNAFATVAKEHPDALVVFADRVFLHNRAMIAEHAVQQHLPTAVTHQELVNSGCLFSFGANYADMHRRAATYVDKILRGASPAELPIEQPEIFELVINMRTAAALGVTIPESMRLRADRVIE